VAVKVALEQVCLQVRRFTPFVFIAQILYSPSSIITDSVYC